MTKADFFKWSLAGHARTLARAYGANRKLCLLTEKGRQLLIEIFLASGKVNQMSAVSILSAFCDLPKFSGQTKSDLLHALRSMQAGLDKEQQKSLYDKIQQQLDANA
eukprot:g8974.t1